MFGHMRYVGQGPYQQREANNRWCVYKQGKDKSVGSKEGRAAARQARLTVEWPACGMGVAVMGSKALSSALRNGVSSVANEARRQIASKQGRAREARRLLGINGGRRRPLRLVCGHERDGEFHPKLDPRACSDARGGRRAARDTFRHRRRRRRRICDMQGSQMEPHENQR